MSTRFNKSAALTKKAALRKLAAQVRMRAQETGRAESVAKLLVEKCASAQLDPALVANAMVKLAGRPAGVLNALKRLGIKIRGNVNRGGRAVSNAAHTAGAAVKAAPGQAAGKLRNVAGDANAQLIQFLESNPHLTGDILGGAGGAAVGAGGAALAGDSENRGRNALIGALLGAGAGAGGRVGARALHAGPLAQSSLRSAEGLTGLDALLARGSDAAFRTTGAVGTAGSGLQRGLIDKLVSAGQSL